MITVVVIDDQPLARAGIEGIVAGAADMVHVGSAGDGAAALRLIDEVTPDVALMDLRMPIMGGVEAIRALRATDVRTRVVVLTTFDGDPEIRAALAAGAAGFLGKASEPDEILEAVRAVHADRAAISERALRLLAEPEPAPSVPEVDPVLHRLLGDLTPRERDVMTAAAHGDDNDTIAAAMFISPLTVKTHLARAMQKMHARDRAQLVAFAYRSGLLQTE
ncbi:response regulator transcription factor [Curtobacterium sp. 260]|uniref:response regulator transcription factor n=1 Tax=Curtobacterium sp. 260 TaxID=2817748 RepID=UPI00278B17BD|nr:response regulator transcription factor [Curtobacterium sp. 260]MDP9736826.1 DNA-binding NarL/FixJ family response regulator [Curtobacterium sp. 260]